MKYAFVSTLTPKEMYEELYSISNRNMQDAANALQWNIYNGLCQNLNSEIMLINVLPVGSFPQYCKRAFVKRSIFKTKYWKRNVNISFCNVKLIRNYAQTKNIEKELEKWIKNTHEEKIIFVYTASAVFLNAIRAVKIKYPEIKICDIIADLPDFSGLSSKKTFFAKQFGKYMACESYKCLDNVDYFVLLTKQMAEYLNIKKPFCVMEGIATETQTDKQNYEAETILENRKIIFYSGTLHKKFGIMNLLHAFSCIPNTNYRLQLCGVGDCEEEILKFVKCDSRIEFLGRLPHNKVLELQKKATVLVNPRQNNEEFTKYSFPSKNLEYLSSGVPLVAYKLDGIPNEYDDFIYYVNDNSLESLKLKLIEICEMSNEERIIKGTNARNFVFENKNYLFQTQKIAELISTPWREYEGKS